jgi:ribose 5-phosphate isomerase B
METSKNIALGADHAGYEYKEALKNFIHEQGYTSKDFGTHSNDSVDYPDFAHPLANAVESKEQGFGILICGSANGVAITANKHQGIRAALCWNKEVAALARQHNNANVVCLPSRFVSIDEAKEIVKTFLSTPYEGGRHDNRVNKISTC